jgi:DtxR family Mn-dependent transcriptional regulator
MITRENLTQAVEDYLKTIYEITLSDERATTNQIAERMGVTPASVTGMLKRLAANDPPLLEYRRHHGVELTLAGEQVALEIIRHHRLLELFLHERLGYPWDQVHAEADRLEHVISEDLEERIAQELGDPHHDPHGDPIPSRDLHLTSEMLVPLGDLRPGQHATVQRVRNDDPALLRYLESIELTPQAELTVLDYSYFDGNLRLQVGDRVMVLGPAVTQQIYVEVA